MKQLVLIVILAVGLASCRPDSSARIVGGRSASLGELPYQASLQFWGSTFHFAGASLINSRWVVTTAHGLVGLAANSVNIILGVVRLDAPITNRRSSEIRIHPLFDKPTLLNDIATVQSSVVIAFTSFIAPIALSPTFLNEGITTIISGWGAINTEGTIQPIHLQVASVVTEDCNPPSTTTTTATTTPTTTTTTSSSISPLDMIFTTQHVCAQAPGVGICTNDVGGPMVLNGLLVGIPFYHDPRGCAGALPDGYLRITAYRTWILGNTPI